MDSIIYIYIWTPDNDNDTPDSLYNLGSAHVVDESHIDQWFCLV